MTRFRRWCRVQAVAVCTLLVTTGVWSDDDPYRILYEIIPIDEINREEFSAIGRRVLKNSDHWIAGRSEHFYALGSNIRSVSAAVEEAEFAWTWLDTWLGSSNPPSRRALIAIIDEPGMWKTLVKKHGVRHDSLAMQVQQELYFKDDPGQSLRPDRIAHEVVHLRLGRDGKVSIPLWLEEGLANYTGWRCAVEYNRTRGVTLYRNLPALDASRILPLASLLAQTDYPADPEAAKAFYRQSEEWVAALIEKFGREAFASLIEKAGVNRIDQPAGLREALQTDEQTMDVLEQQVNRHCREAVKF